MIVKCWNCGQDFEHVSSPSAPAIYQLLLHNMFDGDSGGLVTMSVDVLVREVAQIITEHYEQA